VTAAWAIRLPALSAAQLENRYDVSSAEIVSLEEKRSIKTLGQRVGDAITLG
jgi:hypothetical protein